MAQSRLAADHLGTPVGAGEHGAPDAQGGVDIGTFDFTLGSTSGQVIVETLPIVGSGRLVAQSSGDSALAPGVTLSVSSTFTGGVLLQSGYLDVTTDGALGNPAAGKVVAVLSGAVLLLDGTTASSTQPIILAGGSIDTNSGASFGGIVTLAINSAIQNTGPSPSTLHFTGTVDLAG